MGEVYRARDENLGREVAFKLLRSEVTADEEHRSRFEREARVLSPLCLGISRPRRSRQSTFETDRAGRFGMAARTRST